MAEPTVVCPQCKTEIKLTESLAAPLLESVRRDYEQRLTRKDADIAKREKLLHEREATLQKAKETLGEQVAAKLQQERAKIAAEEAKKAKLAFATDLDQKAKEVEDLQEILKERDQKLAEQKKYDLVVPKGGLLFSKDGLDITGEVVKELNKKLPDVKLDMSAAKKEAKKKD